MLDPPRRSVKKSLSLFFLTIDASGGGRGSISADHFRIGLCPLRKWRLEIIFYCCCFSELVRQLLPIAQTHRRLGGCVDKKKKKKKKEAAPDSQVYRAARASASDVPIKNRPFLLLFHTFCSRQKSRKKAAQS